MKKLLTLTLPFLCVFTAAMAQNETTFACTPQTTKQTKRGPVFRATKEQINQAQALLKSRGFYAGEQLGKLDDATASGFDSGRWFCVATAASAVGRSRRV